MNISKQEIKNLEADFPQMLIFDVTNECNLHCVHCPHDELAGKNDYERKHLDLRLFKKIVLQNKNKPLQFIRITGDGEPLIHPNIIAMLEICKTETNIPVNITTNGTLLNERVAEQILALNLDVIDISLDALYKESYEKIRGFHYEMVMKNVFNFLFLKRRLKAKTKIMVNAINRPGMSREIKAFVKYWEKLADFVVIRNLHSASGTVNYIPLKKEREKIERYPCPHLWKRLTIDFNGNVKFCAHDWGNSSIIGNINADRLSDIISGKKLRIIRDSHLNGNYDKIEICKNCIDWSSVKWDLGYEKVMRKLELKG